MSLPGMGIVRERECTEVPGVSYRGASAPSLLWIGNHLSKTHGGTAASEDAIEHLRQRGWRISSASRKRNPILRLGDMIATALKKSSEYNIAIIDVFSGKAFLYAEVLSRLLNHLGKPIVLVLHGGGLTEFLSTSPGRVQRLLSNARLVVSPSRFLTRAFGFLRPDIVLIPNGLDVHRYEFKRRNHAQPSLVWLRAFCSIYNPSMAVDCLASLRPKFPTAHLYMIGPDKRDGSLAKTRVRANTLGIQDAVTFVGPVPRPEVATRLRQGDVFLNTTNYDSFGVTNLEAAASGLCVVTAAVGEHRYLWKDGHDALLVPPNDGKAMADATRNILLNPELASTLSWNGRKNAERFDWAHILPKWEELFMKSALVKPW